MTEETVTAKQRTVRIALRLATVGGLLSLSGVDAPARAADLKEAASPSHLLPFELSKNSVLKGGPLKIGDLGPVSELEADSLAKSAQRDRSYLQRCLQAGPEWLRWSDHGSRLELTWGSTSRDNRVLAAYCDDGVLFLGGTRPRGAEDDSSALSWAFYRDARPFGPVKWTPVAPLAVGSWPRETQYTLNELRAIDPVSRRVLFTGTSEDGEQVLLAAPFAIVPVASARN